MNTSPQPHLSVCIPVYNGGKYIAEAVRSALAQDHPSFEVLVCDNHSSDDTLEILAGFEDPRLSIRTYERHVGMAENWTRTAGSARGHYILMLSADDCLMPGALAHLVQPLSADSSLDLVLGQPTHLDESDDRSFGVAMKRFPAGLVADLERFAIDHTPAININAILFRRELVSFAQEAGLVCDLDLLLRLGKRGCRAHALADLVVAYREHPEALSADRTRMWRETLDCYLQHLPSSRSPGAYRWRLFKTLYWFGSQAAGTTAEEDFRQRFAAAKPHLVVWQRCLLSLVRFRLPRNAAVYARNLLAKGARQSS
jgi:glycosyltransferase involved in cell wall biosynthesis